MRKLLLYLVLIVGFTAVNAQTKFPDKVITPAQKREVVTKKKVNLPVQEEKANATIDFESKVVDYGTIEYKSNGVRKFVFTNNGTGPLIIKKAKGSCGCTVPTWPKEPIAPGVTAEIGVKYATTRPGPFTKTITLTTNADNKPVILTIKGVVNPNPSVKEKTIQRNTEGSPLEKN